MRFIRLMLFFVLLLMAGSVAAQTADLTESFTYPDGKTSFLYPSTWTLENDPKNLVDLYTSTTTIYFADFSFFESADMTASDTLEDALKLYINTFYKKLKIDRAAIKTIDSNGHDAIRYDFVTPDDKKNAFILVKRFNDDTFGLMEAVSQSKSFPEESVVLAIAETFDVPSDTRGRDNLSASTAAAAACTVQTSEDNAVHIHVGPGNNRTSIAFLPADTEFTVLGKATDKEDTIWWKLDKEAVAPGKSAAEAWVSSEDVESSGDCDAVVDVNAPPVIPIVGGGAPPASGGGGDTSGGAQPGSGAWTITYATYAPGSCAGTGTVNIPIDFPPERASVSGGGSSITFDGDVFTNISPGVYQGLYSAPDGSSVLATLRVASPTLMSLEFIVNFKVDGTPCSVTINGTVSHN